jgi:hypothetical protein
VDNLGWLCFCLHCCLHCRVSNFKSSREGL